MISRINTIRLLFVCLGFGLLAASCTYQDIVPADYPQQVVYMPTARNGLYAITSISTSGTYRFTLDQANRKIIIPLGVYRGGVSADGAVAINITANADTVSKLISASTLANTALLPTDKLTLPGTVTMDAGQVSAPFELKVDLNYLLASTQKQAIGVSIDSPQSAVNPLLKTTLISFDPAILRPTPNFTTKPDATTPRKVTFTNSSLNAVSYVWNFGDGSPTVTDAAPVYTYPAAGTYTITLTATGITGSSEAVTKTTTLTVP